MDSQPLNINRDDLAKFIKDPRTIRAFENLASNQGASIDVVTALTEAPVIVVGTVPVFDNDRFLNGSADIALIDNGPKGPLTIELTETGVPSGIYGNSNEVAAFDVDENGRLVGAANVTISASGIGAAVAATTMTAGAGLTGGGDLSANRTFNVGAGSGITVNANDIALTLQTAAGSYTPTVVILANATATTPHTCHYQRVGSVVSVWGSVQVTPTTAAIFTDITITLPAPSAFTSVEDAWGTVTGHAGTTGIADAHPSDDTIQISFVAPSIVSQYLAFSFAYRILP